MIINKYLLEPGGFSGNRIKGICVTSSEEQRILLGDNFWQGWVDSRRGRGSSFRSDTRSQRALLTRSGESAELSLPPRSQRLSPCTGSASAARAGARRARTSSSAGSTGAFSILPPPDARIRPRCPGTPGPAPLLCHFAATPAAACRRPSARLGSLQRPQQSWDSWAFEFCSSVCLCARVQVPSVRGSWYLSSWWDPETWTFPAHHTPGGKTKQNPTKQTFLFPLGKTNKFFKVRSKSEAIFASQAPSCTSADLARLRLHPRAGLWSGLGCFLRLGRARAEAPRTWTWAALPGLVWPDCGWAAVSGIRWADPASGLGRWTRRIGLEWVPRTTGFIPVLPGYPLWPGAGGLLLASRGLTPSPHP